MKIEEKAKVKIMMTETAEVEVADMNRISTLILLFLCLMTSIAAYALDEDVQERYPGAMKPDASIISKARSVDNLDIHFSFDSQVGYDNNVNLDPSRDKDGYTQQLVSLDMAYPLSKKFSWEFGGDIFTNMYFYEKKNNLIDYSPYAAAVYKLTDDIILRGESALDYFSSPNAKKNTYVSGEFSLSVEHSWLTDFSQEIKYTHYERCYPDRKVANEVEEYPGTDRYDQRDELSYILGAFIFNTASLQLTNSIYYNDSNDNFRDYYDYWAYRLKPAVLYFFTDDLYAMGSIIYKHTNYDDRRSREDVNNVINDNKLIYNLSLYYNVTTHLALNIVFSYRENYPDDPYFKYSGSSFSTGLSYTF
jgi:hypothetical protein